MILWIKKHYTFYDFIVNKVRGVCGPLYIWNKVNDVRTVKELTNTEKETSYSGMPEIIIGLKIW
jgi:protein FAM50